MSDFPREEYRGDTLHDQLFVKVFDASSTEIDEHWDTADVRSGYWRLYVNEASGAQLRLADGSLYPLPPGFAHLLPSDVSFSCVNDCALRHHFVHFDLIGAVATAVHRIFTKPLSVPVDRTPSFPDQGTAAPSEAVAFRAKELVYAALGKVFAAQPELSASLRDLGRMAPAVRFIETHLSAPITNRELAARCHLSEDHFGRLFRRRLGQTPAQYVIDRRIAMATQALAFTGDSIEQIAEQLGFANRFHFTRMFSRRMGIPPAAYRRRALV